MREKQFEPTREYSRLLFCKKDSTRMPPRVSWLAGVEMQNAKDTFYVTLRDRLAKLNAARTILLRGVTRPAILVAENELSTDVPSSGVFVLWWLEPARNTKASAELDSISCEIRYTAADDSGIHRGRVLSAMDEELLAILTPAWVLKRAFTMSSDMDMRTRIFWSAPVFKVLPARDGVSERVAKVDVFTYKEAGE
jgi:hypothetical protein